MSVINQGISADVAGGTIRSGGQALANQGVIQAANGGQLDLPSLSSNLGQVSVWAGGTVSLSGAYTNNLVLNLASNVVLCLGGL